MTTTEEARIITETCDLIYQAGFAKAEAQIVAWLRDKGHSTPRLYADQILNGDHRKDQTNGE